MDGKRQGFWRVAQCRSIARIVFVAIAFAVPGVDPAIADSVWMNDDPLPVHGRITQITPDIIVLESSGTPVEVRTILRSAVRTWHQSIDSARLESLRPESPGDYLQYAEELAGIRFDPAAQELSRRLAVIAMHLDINRNRSGNPPPAIAVRSLALLFDIGNDDESRQKLVRLGIAQGLVDHSRETGTPSNTTVRIESPPDPESARFLLEQVQRIRRGEFSADAFAPADQRLVQGLNESIQDWELLMTVQELQECSSATTLSAAQKLRLVRLEIAIADYLETGRQPPAEPGHSNWAITSRLPTIPIPDSVTTRNVSEFDPDSFLWRNGRWVAGDQ